MGGGVSDGWRCSLSREDRQEFTISRSQNHARQYFTYLSKALFRRQFVGMYRVRAH
jgi:hypothetical protein